MNIGSIRVPSLLMLAVYVIISCGGLYLIKVAPSWKTPPFALGFLLYAAGAVLWLVILRFMPLSFAFPIAAGSLVIGTLLTGALFLNESVSFLNVGGSILIILGIAMIANA